MPVYEYYCRACDGVFESLRRLRESSDPASCPVCDRESERMMPTSFAAFTYRDGYPRRIPDKGTYWHLGKEVKQMVSGPVRPNEHPEINKPEPAPRPLKGDLIEAQERQLAELPKRIEEERDRQAAIKEYEWRQEHKPAKPDV